MKIKHSLLLAILAAPALWAFARPADTVSFHPEEGLSLTKVFTEQTELSLEDMTQVVNGEEMDMSMMGDMEMSVSATTTREVTDVYVAMAEGRPARLKRTFDTLGNTTSMSMQGDMMPSQDNDMEGGSELEGMTVVFTWDEEAGKFVASFEEGQDGDSELLEGLTEDMDLRALLPAGEVSADDTWTIDLKALEPVLAPGGNLKIMPEDMGEMMGMGPSPGGDMSQMLGELEGEASGKYMGTRDIDGVTVGVIQVVYDVSSAKDMTDMVNEMMEDMELPEEMGEMDMNIDAVDIEFTFTGEGTLYWDLRAGHMHSAEFTGEMSLASDVAMAMEIPGMGEMEMEISTEMAGTTTLTAKVGGL